MTIRTSALACLATSILLASAAAADETATTTASDDSATAESNEGAAKEPHGKLGEKKYKARINLIARKPLRHDVPYYESLDRQEWDGKSPWQGVRDGRPMVARKIMGFHDPRPHRTRMERILMLSRGPIRGTGSDE